MITPRERDLASIRRAAAAVRLRLRLRRALRVLVPALVVALGAMAVTLVAHQTLPEALTAARVAQIATGLLSLALAAPVVAFARRLPPRAGAVALERHHDLRGRLTAALSFAESPVRTPLMELAIDDACMRSRTLAPREAAPLSLPAGLLLAGGLAAATVATARLETAAPDPAAEAKRPPAARPGRVTLDADDLAALDDAVSAVEGCHARPDHEIPRLRKLVFDLVSGRLDREAALRRIRWAELSLAREEGPAARTLRERLADARDLVRQHRDPARAARASSFARRAAAALDEATGRDAAPGPPDDTTDPTVGRADAPLAPRAGPADRVILAAATRGFRGAGYRDAFVAYQEVAREHLEQDRIPDGQRFYVRRYFDLIRPRP